MKIRLNTQRTSLIAMLAIVVNFSACRGAPCSNCGSCGPGYGAPPQTYGQPSWQTNPGPPVMAPGNTVQPGFYQPGSVPVQPTQQIPPGTAWGG